ncbi:hypothetical protein ACHQM5_016583 [Ranunculus cassubicifolius]
MELSTETNSANGEEHKQTLQEGSEEDLYKLLIPNLSDLPPNSPPSAIESNFTTYFAPDFLKPGHDQYVHRHPNGLCVIGLAPTHIALKENETITCVDFNVGKSNRSEIKVSGKHKKNALQFQPDTALCKVFVKETAYVVRCCVRGSLLEVNDRLLKQPELLNSSADREGYIAIIMPRPADWLKFKSSSLTLEDYKKLRNLS